MTHVARAVAAPLFIAGFASLLQAQAPIPKLEKVAAIGTGWIGGMTESLNGRFFLGYVVGKREVRIYDRTGAAIDRISNADGFVLARAGNMVAFTRRAEGGRAWDHHIWTVALDSSTGRLAGEPRRVTIRFADFPDFSPDGKSIAYVRPDSTKRSIAIIPVTGGDERIVATLPGDIRFLRWAPDGRHLYFAHAPGLPTPPRIARIATTGGKPDSLAYAFFLLGFSSDGRHFAAYPYPFIPWQGDHPEVAIYTLDGKEVKRFASAQHTRAPSWSPRDPNVMVATQMEVPIALKYLSLPDGKLHTVAANGEFNRRPQFTPDGKRLVYQTRIGDRYRFAVSDPDGSNARELPVKDSPGDFVISPDGRLVAFGSHMGRALNVLDLQTGMERRLPATNFTSDFRWRSDAQAIRYVDIAGTPERSIREQFLDGRGSVLMKITGPDYQGRQIHILDDTLVIAQGRNDVVAIDLRTGARTLLYDGRAGWVMGWPMRSPDGQWLGFGVNDDKSGLARGYMVSLDGKQQRPIGQGFRCDANITWFLPDMKHVLLRGYPKCESDGGHEEIYLVPLNGGPMRHLSAADTAADINRVLLSPDGRRAYYESERPYRASIVRFRIP